MSEPPCTVCSQQWTAIGVLCRECARELRGPGVITPEQIVDRAGTLTPAALIDLWGRVHRIAASTVIGRDISHGDLLVLDGSISRAHARLARDGDRWLVRDLDSKNGTFVEENRVIGETELRDGDRVQVGTIAFFFIERAADVDAFVPDAFVGYTERTPPPRTTKIDKVGRPLPPIRLRLEEPSGGGGALLAIEGKRVQLTVPQFELLSMLIARMHVEAARQEHERGFVSLIELASTLSLESALPSEDHVRQLVRRLRRALAKAGVENLIETRYGIGYRLRGTPVPA